MKSEKQPDIKIVNKIKEMETSDRVLLLVCVVFYLVMCFMFGVQLCADSGSYIRMTSAREPVYPLFLALFRGLFGEKIYLTIVIVVQNLLMAIAVYSICIFLKRTFHLNKYVVSLLVLIHFGVAFLCQFAAGRASVYPNSILTEGITLSLWLIFMTLLLKLLWEKNMKYLIQVMVLSAVMMDTRKQMAITYLVALGTLIFGWIGQKGYWKRILLTFGSVILSVLLAIGGTRLYNLMLRGEFAQNTRDMNLVLTTSLYVADKEDSALIEEETVRILFEQVYDILEEKECNYRFAGEGWRNLESHYSHSFDQITIDTTGPMFIEYAESLGFAEGLEAEQEADRMSGVIVSSLFLDNIGTYFRVYLASIGNGLINTVAKRSGILDIYALVAYIGYIGLMILCFLKKETRKAGQLGMAVMMGILVNVCVAAALIFCQTRYMIYNMALFYMAGLVMVEQMIRNLKLVKEVEASDKK